EGVYLHLADGRTIIDGSAGAAVASIGHGNRRVAAAIGEQALKMSYANTMMFSSEPAEELANLLISETAGMSRAFFVSSGSAAMEAALKLGRQYFVERGETERIHFISRRQSYHGN